MIVVVRISSVCIFLVFCGGTEKGVCKNFCVNYFLV